MAKVLPTIFNISIENIKRKLKDIESLGYTKEETIKMTSLLPALISYSTENIKQKIDDIMSLGYSKEEVIKMTITLPALFGYSIENITKKINFYKEIGLDFIITNYTKNLMQSVELSYARYNYFKNDNNEITSYSYLFCNEKRFKKQFGITKQELLQMYPYKNKGDVIKDAR